MKTGEGWKACYDSESELYTAESFWAGRYDLYEITEEIFSELKTKGMKRRDAQELISTGRHLYLSVSDCNNSYDIAVDENYPIKKAIKLYFRRLNRENIYEELLNNQKHLFFLNLNFFHYCFHQKL